MTIECVLIARDNADTIGAAVASIIDRVDRVLVVLNAESDEETGDAARSAGARVVRTTQPFRDFTSARNDALSHAHAEWILQLDADDAYTFGSSFDGWPESGEAHSIVSICDGIAWTFVRLFRSRLRYREDCHEYVDIGDDAQPDSIVAHVNYLRTAPQDPKARARRNAALLEGHTDPRSIFHLGFARKTLGDLASALELFEQRFAMLGSEQERFYAALEAARIRAMLGCPLPEVYSAYERARTLRPSRAEPYVEYAKLLRKSGDIEGARDLAKLATELPPCMDVVFIDIAAHTWRPWAELALCENLLGHDAEYARAYEVVRRLRPDAPPMPTTSHSNQAVSV